MQRIFVGNLPYSATEDDVRELFAEYGEVGSVDIITDHETGRSRGFGFVDMPEEEAVAAMAALDGAAMEGRNLNVDEARPRT